jgi:hypothetical protein
MKYPKYCGWCKKLIELIETPNSTGICPECAKRELQILLSEREKVALTETVNA